MTNEQEDYFTSKLIYNIKITKLCLNVFLFLVVFSCQSCHQFSSFLRW